MAIRRRIALGLFVAIFAAAPTLAIAAQLCSACCCPPSPCHQAQSPCDASFVSAPCCDQVVPALPSALKPASDGALLHAPAPASWLPVADVRTPLGGLRTVAADARSSPLRLSVVLRI